ncbi:MAG: hypothetical protein K2P81_10500, partial [Bacteriovoracaceae bacterium]|nr:hypothetical protein [Bacteriovoracaceae bacterium]
NPQVTGVDLFGSGSMSEINFSENHIVMMSNNLSLRVGLKKLSFDQVIKKEISGNIILIKIKAQCENIKLTIPQFKFELKAKNVVLGEAQWRPEIESSALRIPSKGWTLEPFHCSGLDGIDAQITELVRSNLTETAELNHFIEGWLASQLQSLWIESLDKIFKLNAQGMKITRIDAPRALGLVAVGEMPIKRNLEIRIREVQLDEVSSVKPQLVFSQEGFAAILEDNLWKQVPASYNLQNNASFKKLMNSRFLQSFVWPDLKRYPSNTPFYVMPDPENSALLLEKDNSNNLRLHMRALGTLQTTIQYAQITYLNWDLNLTAPLSLTLNQGDLSLKTGNATSSLNWYFSPFYSLLYKPEPKIDTSVMEPSIRGLFENVSVIQKLPSLNFNNREYKLNQLRQTNDLITMDWQ